MTLKHYCCPYIFDSTLFHGTTRFLSITWKSLEANASANLGPVVQSIVSLTSSLRGQLVKSFTTLSRNTLKFFIEKMRSFCSAKASHIFQQKNNGVFQILTFEILTKRYLTTSLVLNNRALDFMYRHSVLEITQRF